MGTLGLSTGDDWAVLVAAMLEEKGWVLDLGEQHGSGERVLEPSTIFGGLVMFTTFKPTDDICGFGGSGAVYGAHYATGSAGPGGRGIGIFNQTPPVEGATLSRSLDLEEGRPSRLSIHVGKEDGGKIFIQGSTGEIKEIEAGLKDPTGSVYWYER